MMYTGTFSAIMATHQRGRKYLPRSRRSSEVSINGKKISRQLLSPPSFPVGACWYSTAYTADGVINVLVDHHHHGAMWGGIPLIACDVFEHAYYHKDGPGRAAYIDNFLNNLHWGRINERYKMFVEQGKKLEHSVV